MSRATLDKNNDKNNRRTQLLRDLGTAATKRPLDRVALEEAKSTVEQELTKEVMVDMVGILANFESTTKVVDATGRKPLAPQMYSVMKVVLGSVNWIYSFF